MHNDIGTDVAIGIRQMADSLDDGGVVWLHEFMWTVALLAKNINVPSTGSKRWPVDKMRVLLHRFADCLTAESSQHCASTTLQELLSPKELSGKEST